MDNPSTLRLMEKEELKSFKKLMEAKNRKLLDKVISQYCKIGMCNYSIISMMYNKEEESSKEELTW